MKKLDALAALLLVIGGLNWGLFGLFKIDLVESLVVSWSAGMAVAIYTLVGLAALYQALTWRAIQNRWNVSEIPVRMRTAADR
jgi:uncharacterized membrane protein YuzA (DUF378 family)